MIKYVIYIAGVLGITLAGVYITLQVEKVKLDRCKSKYNKLERQYNNIKLNYAVAQETINKNKQLCDARVQLVTTKFKVQQATTKEIQTKIQKKGDYEILASDTRNDDATKCGCIFDGTGWVFK